jgi:hypothetical protein
MGNEWTEAGYAKAYLAQMRGIPHRAEGEATLLSEVDGRGRRLSNNLLDVGTQLQ